MGGPCIGVLCLADTYASEVHPVFNPVAPYGYLHVFVYSGYHKSRLVCLMLSDINLDITRFCEEQRRLAQETVNRDPIAGAGKVRHNLHSSL